MNDNNYTLSIYQKLGDIAKQIETLENVDPDKSIHGVGYTIETPEDLQNMINFHWVRIRFLEELLQKTRDEILQEKKNISERLCSDCKKNSNTGCREDFFNYCFDSLIEAIL